jgi:hypothetical protein
MRAEHAVQRPQASLIERLDGLCATTASQPETGSFLKLFKRGHG